MEGGREGGKEGERGMESVGYGISVHWSDMDSWAN